MDQTQLSPDPALVRLVFDLACTPFELTEFAPKVSQAGWIFELTEDDRFGLVVQNSRGDRLGIDLLGTSVLCARWPFYFWHDYYIEVHDNPAEYYRERKLFDTAFDAASRVCEQILPRPFGTWRDSDKDAHRATFWEGTHGILVLQQACFDPADDGLEVNFWLDRGPASEFQPTSPLIDWLCDRCRKVHDDLGFPDVHL